MHPTATMLLASIDHTLASVRAALAAGADPEQAEEARTELSRLAGADVARLVSQAPDGGWGELPTATREAIARAGDAAGHGDLYGVERELTTARESLGGRSR